MGYSDHRSSIESKRSRNSRSSPINFLENTSKINLATKPAAGGGGGGALGGMLAAGILGGVTKKFEEDMGKHGDQSVSAAFESLFYGQLRAPVHLTKFLFVLFRPVVICQSLRTQINKS